MTQALIASLAPLAQNGGGLFAGAAGLIIVFWILGIIATVFWVWMIVDVLTSRMDSGEKILWFLVVFFLHLLGAIIYYFAKRREVHGHDDTGGRPAMT
jgi:hypothetical protein